MCAAQQQSMTMEWWRKLRSWFFARAMRQARSKEMPRRAVAWSEVQRVAVLVDADQPEMQAAAQEWVRALKQAGKQVLVLECTRAKAPKKEEPVSNRLYRNEVNWYGKPLADKAHEFAEAPTDLLVVFAERLTEPMQWLSLLSKSSCRAGMDREATDCLDLIVEVKRGQTSRFVKDLEGLLRLNEQAAVSGS